MATDMIVRGAPAPLLPMEPEQAALMMHRYQELCAAILTPDDVIGVPGTQGGFVKRSGYSKLATFYGVSTAIVQQSEYRDAEGELVRAKATVRATHPNGRTEDGDGACSRAESRFRSPTGRQKIEHDLPATAVTRARNRAISNLIGFGQVSAEEAEGETAAASPHPFGEPANRGEEDSLLNALEVLGAGAQPINRLVHEVGYLPRVAAQAVLYVAAAVASKTAGANGKPQAEPEPEDGGETGTDSESNAE